MNKKSIRFQTGIKILCILIVLIFTVSCNKQLENKLGDSSWRSVERTIEYDTETVVEDASQFSHYLGFNDDGSFYRTYETGTWELDGKTLFVTSYEADCESTYEIIKCTSKELILESYRGSPGAFVYCGFGEVSDPKITEVFEPAE